MHSTGTGQPVETQDVFFWRLAGRSAPTGLAIVHWIGCINAIKLLLRHTHSQLRFRRIAERMSEFTKPLLGCDGAIFLLIGACLSRMLRKVLKYW